MVKDNILRVIGILTLLLFLISLSGCMNYTGFAVFDNMNMKISEDQTYTITLDEESTVNSIKVNGEFEGDGAAFIYLDLGNEVKTILNSKLLENANDNGTTSSSVIEFSNICEDTCNLDLIGKEFTISFIVQDSVLNIEGFDVDSEPILNVVEEANDIFVNETITINESVYENEENNTLNDINTTIIVNETFTENNNSLVSNYTSNSSAIETGVSAGENESSEEAVVEPSEPVSSLNNSEGSPALVEGVLPQNISEPLPPPAPTNITVSGGNISKEKTTYYRVMINSPVRWKKRIELTEEVSNIKVLIPKDAENIIVTEIENGEEIRIDNNKLSVEETFPSTPVDGESTNFITGNVVRYMPDNSFTNFVKRFFKGGITGYVIGNEPIVEEIILKDEISLVIDELIEEIEIEYYLPGPTASEKIINENKKEVTIISDIHYENVLSFTDIKEVPLSAINLYWIKDGNKVKHTFDGYDTDNNGLIDYIEWIVPHLSNQTFEIELELLTVQSYPQVGGYWTTEFSTVGIADLEITGWDGTYFDVDLVHIALKCNGVELNADYDGDSVYYADYECGGVGEHIVQVLTEGKHTQKFDFGGVIAYAHNFASVVPNTINLQGKLENSSGDVVTGTHNFNFSLYTVSTGGSAEWTEEQTGVSVDADGIYDVILGSVDAINLDFDEAYYLGVEVDGDGEMTPRINLTSTPYAQRAKFADTVECSDCIDSTEILNYSILPKDLDNLSGIADEDILTYESTGGVFEWHTPAELITAGDSLSWSSSTLNVADDWYDSVNDIPNATPADGVQSFSTANQIYDYIDGLGLSGAYTAGDGLTLTGSQFNVSDGGIDGTQLADTIILDANLAITQADFDVNFDANTLFVDGTESRVGIGTITPGEKLYVDGNINVTVGNDICIEGDKCLSEASVAGGDITAVNTAEKYLTGGDTTGAISLLLNETELNSTIDARDSGDTTYTAGNGLSLGGTEFTVDAHTAITVDASGVSVTADSIDGTQLSDEITLDADLSLNGGGSYDVNISGVYIDSDGQLGLGTIPSSRALDVVGNSRFNGGVDFSGGNVNIIENLSVGQNINLTGDLFVNGDDIGLYDGQINTDNGPIGVDSCGYGSTSLGMCTESGVITLGYSGPKLYLKSGGIGISYDDGFSGGNDPDTELHIDGGVCIDNNAVCTDPGDGNLNVVGNINIKGDFTGLGIGNFTGNVYAANFSSHSPLRLQTEGTTRIYVGDNKGYVGINTENPKGLLHVQDGSLLFNGTSGATPTSGAGTRMMWIPEKAAFRAGEVTATEWDAANVGAYSFAGGYRTKASGGSSTAFGSQTEASGGNSFAIGYQTKATGAYSLAIGANTLANAHYAIAMGQDMIVDEEHSFGISLDDPGTAYNITDANTMAIMGGEVGIGTVNPSAPLHIESNSQSSALRLEENAGNNEYFTLGVGSDGDLNFYQDDGDILLNLVDDCQTVGINQEAACSGAPTLQVFNTGNTWGWIADFESNYSNAFIGIRGNHSSSYDDNGIGIVTTSTTQEMILRVDDTNVIRIEDTGEVGIGTSDPAYTLDVVGTIRASNYSADNGSIGWTGFCRNDKNLYVRNGLVIGCS